MALLSGDALLSLSQEILLDKTPSTVPDDVKICLAIELSRATGAEGMVGGQVEDLIYTGLSDQQESPKCCLDEETVASIHRRKTGALIRFAAWSGAKIAGANAKQLEALWRFGEILGLAFQIADDLLDVTGDVITLGKTPGKDEATQKATWVRLFGQEESKSRLLSLEGKGNDLLEGANLSETSTLALSAILNCAIHRIS
jgi:farnesyl diphosphate synthase